MSEAKGNGGRAEAANQSDFIFATRANVFRVVSDVYMLLFCGHAQFVVTCHRNRVTRKCKMSGVIGRTSDNKVFLLIMFLIVGNNHSHLATQQKHPFMFNDA